MINVNAIYEVLVKKKFAAAEVRAAAKALLIQTGSPPIRIADLTDALTGNVESLRATMC